LFPLRRCSIATENKEWTQATSFINTELLRKRKVSHGDKIVPGSYHGDKCESQVHHLHVDGRPLDYPPIPVFCGSANYVVNMLVRSVFYRGYRPTNGLVLRWMAHPLRCSTSSRLSTKIAGEICWVTSNWHIHFLKPALLLFVRALERSHHHGILS
jgi:hypothetical protein